MIQKRFSNPSHLPIIFAHFEKFEANPVGKFVSCNNM